MKLFLLVNLICAALVFQLGAAVIINPYRFAAPVTPEIYYVDPSASGSTEDGTTANPYLSLNGALAGECNKTFTAPIQIRCRTASSTPDTTRATTSALTLCVPSAANYLEIIAETGHRASAAWDATKYHLYPAYGVQAGTALDLNVPYVRVEGLQIGISSQTAIAEIVYWSQGASSRMNNCLVQSPSSTLQTRGISTINGMNVWNCVFDLRGSTVHAGTSCFKNHGATRIQSSTFIQGGGIITVDCGGNAGDDVTIKNSYAGGSGFQDWYTEGSGTMALTTCGAGDTTGTAGLDSIAVSTANFVNVTAGSTDFHIPTGSALKNVGTDTSGDAAPFNFTNDIDGATRSGTWDVGADEF